MVTLFLSFVVLMLVIATASTRIEFIERRRRDRDRQYLDLQKLSLDGAYRLQYQGDRNLVVVRLASVAWIA